MARGSVPSGADFSLRPFALGNVAVNQHNAAIRHRVVSYLDDRAIRAGPLEAIMIADPCPQAFDLCLRVGLAELATFG